MASFPFNETLDIGTQTYTFRDAKGNLAKMTFYMNALAGTLSSAIFAAQTWSQGLKPLIIALTNAALQSGHGPDTVYGVAQYGAHAANGAYESVIEKAQFVIQDNSGQLHRFEVPAPKVSIFKADKVTIDPANTAVAAFVTYLTQTDANGVVPVTRQNVPLANYMGGVFRGRKLRRRLNILVLEPDLTASLPAE